MPGFAQLWFASRHRSDSEMRREAVGAVLAAENGGTNIGSVRGITIRCELGETMGTTEVRAGRAANRESTNETAANTTPMSEACASSRAAVG